MSTKTKNTKPVVDAPKRGRGRPASFPDVAKGDMSALLVHIPTASRQMVRDVSAKRGECMNVTIARFIAAGHAAAMRTKKPKAKVTA